MYFKRYFIKVQLFFEVHLMLLALHMLYYI